MATKEHPLEIRPEEREQLVRQAADRRSLYELAEAVREHEARVRRHVGGPRPHDLALYRRLRRVGALRVSGGDKDAPARAFAPDGTAPLRAPDRYRFRSSRFAAPGDALGALVEAIRAHELLTGNRSVPRRPADHVLYAQLERVGHG